MSGWVRPVWLALGGAALLDAGCRDPAPMESDISPPELVAVAATPNGFNALSAAVTFRVQRADSARLNCRPDSGPATEAPNFPIEDGAARLVILGLSADTDYRCEIVAQGPGGTTTSEPVAYHTAHVPRSLAGVRLEITGVPPPGYIVTEVTNDGEAASLAFDTAGRVGWYRSFAAQPGELAMQTEQHPTGNFTLYLGASTGWQPVDGRYIEFRPDGEIVRTYAAGTPYYTDSHELVLSHAGGTVSDVHLFGYDLRITDLTALGGRADHLVAGHALMRQSPSGGPRFLWNAWDHFSVADWMFIPPNLGSSTTIDFDHPNSLAIDREGDYVVSFASLGEITRIDAASGQILWRFGGRHTQFTIVGDPLGGFGFQHDVRVLGNGDLLFFDNGLLHTPRESRAVQYRLDVAARSATLVWEYRHDPPVFTPFVGSVQRLGSGNTLVGFGAASFMTEVTPDGQVLWEGRLTVDGNPVPFFYRARRVASLYRYEAP